MSVVLPKEIAYSQTLPSLPADTINRSIVVAPSNGANFTQNQIIQFDLPASGFLDPDSLYLRYNATSVVATADGALRGTPATAPMLKLEILFGSQVSETIMNYNMVYNMVTNLQMNVAQKAGCANLGYLDLATTPTFDNQNGRVLPTGTYTYPYSFPLMCLLSGAEKLVPLFDMPNIRIQLTLDTNSNIFHSATGALTSYTLSNLELCFDQVNFGAGVEQMVRSMGEKVYIKSHSWATMSQLLPAVSSGTQELIYNARYASIRSLFSNFGGTSAASINKNFDSYDITSSNGDYQYYIAGAAYPDRPISTRINKCGSLMELKMAINGGLHSLQAQNMSITPREYYVDGNETTTIEIPAKFWIGVNCEKFSTAGALLSGVSTQNSAISLRINSGTSLAQSFIITLIVLFDALIEIDFISRNAMVRQ